MVIVILNEEKDVLIVVKEQRCGKKRRQITVNYYSTYIEKVLFAMKAVNYGKINPHLVTHYVIVLQVFYFFI